MSTLSTPAASPVGTATEDSPGIPIQRAVVAGAVALALALAAPLAGFGSRLPLLLVIGIACGITLHHAAFGFTSAYRRMFLDRDTAGVEAQLLMLATATVLFAPALAAGSILGTPVVGANAPVGWQVAIGAFVFGLGMQLGDGCGSGTLYKVGGGSVRMVVTLVTFCAGGFWASLHMGAWQSLPDLGTQVLGESLGWRAAVGVQLGVLGLLYVGLRAVRRPSPQGAARTAARGWRRVVAGTWPLVAGAILLAVLNFTTLAVAGHPWSITWGFTLWAAKLARLAGWDPDGASFWAGDFQREALDAPVLGDSTSVMNVGIILGAVLAAALAGRFAARGRLPPRSLLAAAIGGLLMGYGARIAFGCNIGAFFSGVASTSLHGWLWILMALPGNWIGARLRPRFGLST
ncbi:MAG: YeeE/YedE family protein [Casimicrobiaceae bacterium]